AEQKLIAEYAEELIKTCDPLKAQMILSEMALVYYKDFYFRESEETYKKLQEMTLKSTVDLSYVKSLYNVALFRIFFYRQRLAFGPYLAMGIMLSSLYGNWIVDQYFKMMKNLVI
ncbi:MAG: hypothetical protein JXR69_05260, partial [Candidatus Delongbacteria bacterium]|nr:hypothetical protein [Candidatus Delongbacteria bacterium]